MQIVAVPAVPGCAPLMARIPYEAEQMTELVNQRHPLEPVEVDP